MQTTHMIKPVPVQTLTLILLEAIQIFTLKDDVTTTTDVVFDDSDSSSGKTTTSFTDSWGRSFIWHSAFQIRFDNGVTLQDPGVYIRNDSNLPITVTSSVDTTIG